MGFFRYGELPLVILALLSNGGMNGYELIGALARAFRPHYVPSPGSIYPALAALEREKLIVAEESGGTKRYEVTKQGRTALEAREEELSQVELRTGTYLRDDDVWAEMSRLDAAIRSAQRTVDPVAIGGIVRMARISVQSLIEEE